MSQLQLDRETQYERERERPMTGEAFRAISDVNNWQDGRFPCPLARVIFPDGVNVLIDKQLKASQVILPRNGAIVFSDSGRIELSEKRDLQATGAGAAVSCAFGEDALFKGNLHHSHETPGSPVSLLLRLLLDLATIVTVLSIAYGVYLHRTQGYTVREIVHHVWHQVTARLTMTSVSSPLQGTFNFVRFHGDEGHLELEMGNASDSLTQTVTSDKMTSYTSLSDTSREHKEHSESMNTAKNVSDDE